MYKENFLIIQCPSRKLIMLHFNPTKYRWIIMNRKSKALEGYQGLRAKRHFIAQERGTSGPAVTKYKKTPPKTRYLIPDCHLSILAINICYSPKSTDR